MEKLMRIWAKISAILLVLMFLVFTVSYIGDINKILTPLPFHPLLIVFLFLGGLIILSSPLFHYGFSKKIVSDTFKIWSQIITIFIMINLIVNIFKISSYQEFLAIFSIYSLLIIFSIPLFYFAWKKN
jgi:hypothetical protein